MSRRPDFVIIGAQKAGSVFVQSSLRRHPDVWLPRGEDPFFRDPVYDPDQLERFALPYARRTEARAGMKCPDYLGRPEVPVRLRHDLSAPDLIVCLRDPVQRALSAYFWWMRWGLIPIEPADQGLRKILDGAYGELDATVAPIVDWGLYHKHLSHYLESFPREKLLVLLNDDLRRDSAAALSRAYEFLGVDPERAPSSAATKDNAGVYSLQRLRFLGLRNRYMLRWDEHRTYPSVPKPTNPVHRLYCNGIAAADRYLLARMYSNEKPELSSELTGRLQDLFHDDVVALEHLLGRDLSTWRNGRAVPLARDGGRE